MQKFKITGLKSGLKATENIHIAFISRYGFPKLNATYTTLYKKHLKQKYRPEFLNARSYQKNLKEEPKRFNLMCVVRLLIKISTEVVTATQYYIWTSYHCYISRSGVVYKLGTSPQENRLQTASLRAPPISSQLNILRAVSAQNLPQDSSATSHLTKEQMPLSI